jgi:hypothetical protein
MRRLFQGERMTQESGQTSEEAQAAGDVMEVDAIESRSHGRMIAARSRAANSTLFTPAVCANEGGFNG